MKTLPPLALILMLFILPLVLFWAIEPLAKPPVGGKDGTGPAEMRPKVERAEPSVLDKELPGQTRWSQHST